MRRSATVLILFFTTSVYAYRGRPIADLRFDNRIWTTDTRVARNWVRVTNRCGSIDSQAMNVTVQGKRRAARR